MKAPHQYIYRYLGKTPIANSTAISSLLSLRKIQVTMKHTVACYLNTVALANSCKSRSMRTRSASKQMWNAGDCENATNALPVHNSWDLEGWSFIATTGGYVPSESDFPEMWQRKQMIASMRIGLKETTRPDLLVRKYYRDCLQCHWGIFVSSKQIGACWRHQSRWR